MPREVEFLVEGQQMIKRYDKMLSEVSRNFEMNRTELEILLFLFENPAKDTAKDVVEFRRMTKSCVSKSIDSLVRQGYLTVRDDAGDRRILHLIIQDKASEAIEAGLTAREHMTEKITNGISEEEKEFFFGIYRKILENMK